MQGQYHGLMPELRFEEPTNYFNYLRIILIIIIIIIIIIIVIIIILIQSLFKEETTFDKTTSIYHMFLNIETVITK